LITINIPVFGELMWIGYIAFLTPEEFDAVLRALDVRRYFKSSVTVASAEVEPNPFPVLGAASIVGRLDGAHGLLGPHRVDAAPSRTIEVASSSKLKGDS
jgi:hypothetical protein